jgi:tRNA(Arg) A34 adenosine deaminase TadA
MCFSACLWAKMGRIVYACRIEDAKEFGIMQIPISSSRMKELGQSEVELVAELLRDESLRLSQAWSRGQSQSRRNMRG